MKHNTEKILALLQDGLDREKLVLSMGLKKTRMERDNQEGRIAGIELAMSWIENNVS